MNNGFSNFEYDRTSDWTLDSSPITRQGAAEISSIDLSITGAVAAAVCVRQFVVVVVVVVYQGVEKGRGIWIPGMPKMLSPAFYHGIAEWAASSAQIEIIQRCWTHNLPSHSSGQWLMFDGWWFMVDCLAVAALWSVVFSPGFRRSRAISNVNICVSLLGAEADYLILVSLDPDGGGLLRSHSRQVAAQFALCLCIIVGASGGSGLANCLLFFPVCMLPESYLSLPRLQISTCGNGIDHVIGPFSDWTVAGKPQRSHPHIMFTTLVWRCGAKLSSRLEI